MNTHPKSTVLVALFGALALVLLFSATALAAPSIGDLYANATRGIVGLVQASGSHGGSMKAKHGIGSGGESLVLVLSDPNPPVLGDEPPTSTAADPNSNSSAAGPEGPMGPAGADGAAGVDGAAGADGAEGPAGSSGATGSVGATGSAGATGSVGATGPAGLGLMPVAGDSGGLELVSPDGISYRIRVTNAGILFVGPTTSQLWTDSSHFQMVP